MAARTATKSKPATATAGGKERVRPPAGTSPGELSSGRLNLPSLFPPASVSSSEPAAESTAVSELFAVGRSLQAGGRLSPDFPDGGIRQHDSCTRSWAGYLHPGRAGGIPRKILETGGARLR